MLNVVDSYCWEEHRKILTPKESGIAALRSFGIYTSNQAGQPLQTHIHKDCMEIVFLLKGFQIYEVENAHFNLSGYNVFVAYQNEPHSSGNYPESICNLIWMQIDLTEGLPFFGLDKETAAALRQVLRSLPRVFGADAELASTLSSAFYALANQDPLSRQLGQQQLVCGLLRMKQLSSRISLQHLEFIDNAIPYIHDNLKNSIRLEDVAACCGLSLSRFKVKFKEETGTTPRDYINRIKIEEAKKLLKAGKSVTNTALDLGFSTSNYFAVLFRKYTGQTPTQYREESALLSRHPIPKD